MEIWGVWGLFDLGSDPREDAYCGSAAGFGPLVFEDTIRIDHPEAVPKDSHGIRTQCGTIRFIDPIIRRTLIDRLTAIMDQGYDGLLLYTYSENLSLWFLGEFDRGSEGPLSASEVTTFVRELRAVLRAKKKHLALQIDPRTSFRDGPSPWLGLSPDVNNVGRVPIAWKDWLREGLLDEIVVAVPEGSKDEAVKLAEEIMQDFPKIPVVLLARHDPIPPSRAMAAVDARRSTNFQARFLEKARSLKPIRDWAKNSTTPLTDPQSLKKADSAAIVPAFLSLKTKPQIPWIPDLLSVIRSHPEFPVRQQAAETLGSWGIAATEALDSLITDKDSSVRRVAFQAAAELPPPSRIRWLEPALRDTDPYNRWIAVRGLLVTPGPTDSARVISGILQNDPDPTVRSAAAWMVRPGMTESPELFSALKNRFIALHDEPAWRWEFRTVGDALLRSGPDGLKFLHACLSKTKPPEIADSAWRVLYVPQDGAALKLVDSSQAAEACRAYLGRPPASQHPEHEPPTK
ncbi:MAG: HEAT repeat domain-containing protein [Verrucomicrobia bacterium]|nr:HEAT repeat domain-containing protein [Verrucomicrobiota bacterium]